MQKSPDNLRQIALDAFARRSDDSGILISKALADSPHDGALLIADAASRAEHGIDLPFDRLEAILGQSQFVVLLLEPSIVARSQF